jgi:uncharacterized protein YutE (UPF0331/DUF86 family)
VTDAALIAKRLPAIETCVADLRRDARLFDLLAEHGWIQTGLAETLRRMSGFRNVLVYGYDDVDLRVVEDVATNRHGDLLAFVDSVRARLG